MCLALHFPGGPSDFLTVSALQYKSPRVDTSNRHWQQFVERSRDKPYLAHPPRQLLHISFLLVLVSSNSVRRLALKKGSHVASRMDYFEFCARRRPDSFELQHWAALVWNESVIGLERISRSHEKTLRRRWIQEEESRRKLENFRVCLWKPCFEAVWVNTKLGYRLYGTTNTLVKKRSRGHCGTWFPWPQIPIGQPRCHQIWSSTVNLRGSKLSSLDNKLSRRSWVCLEPRFPLLTTSIEFSVWSNAWTYAQELKCSAATSNISTLWKAQAPSPRSGRSKKPSLMGTEIKNYPREQLQHCSAITKF